MVARSSLTGILLIFLIISTTVYITASRATSEEDAEVSKLNDILNIIVKSSNFSNRSGYIIQSRSEPQRLIFISEKTANSGLTNDVAAYAVPMLKPKLQNMPIKTINSPQMSVGKVGVNKVNVHLYVQNSEKVQSKLVDNLFNDGSRNKRSEIGTTEPELAQDALQAMKRVIFIRCPFYPCPRGHVCDHHTLSCRPVFYPDIDY
ncbi:hypothetical protein CHUAL_004018 [Chamberlinius hualienensis]